MCVCLHLSIYFQKGKPTISKTTTNNLPISKRLIDVPCGLFAIWNFLRKEKQQTNPSFMAGQPTHPPRPNIPPPPAIRPY